MTAFAGTLTTTRFDARLLERVFADCFKARYATVLEGGFDEPLYLPPGADGALGRIRYRADYFASALHEVAHWCVAGEQRRQQEDYGYWYAPDGRSPQQQAAFEQVEYQPQALEWIFSSACGYPFKLSADNLDATGGELPETAGFARRVARQARAWQRDGLAPRPARFFRALCAGFGTNGVLSEYCFNESGLG